MIKNQLPTEHIRMFDAEFELLIAKNCSYIETIRVYSKDEFYSDAHLYGLNMQFGIAVPFGAYYLRFKNITVRCIDMNDVLEAVKVLGVWEKALVKKHGTVVMKKVA